MLIYNAAYEDFYCFVISSLFLQERDQEDMYQTKQSSKRKEFRTYCFNLGRV